MTSSVFPAKIYQTATLAGFTTALSRWRIRLKDFNEIKPGVINNKKLVENGQNSGSSFENIEKCKGPFGNNSFQNCVFNFNSNN